MAPTDLTTQKLPGSHIPTYFILVLSFNILLVALNIGEYLSDKLVLILYITVTAITD